MTIDRMTLKALLEKGSDDDLLREMIGFVANRMMDMDVEGLTGASQGKPEELRAHDHTTRRCAAFQTSVFSAISSASSTSTPR